MFVKLKRAWPDHQVGVAIDKIVAVEDITITDDKNDTQYGLPRCRIHTMDPKGGLAVWGSVEDVTAAIRAAFLAHQVDLGAIRRAAP